MSNDNSDRLRELYLKGRSDAESAIRSRGGTRGLQWLIEQKGYVGEERQVFVFGYEERMREFAGGETRLKSLGIGVNND